MCSDRSPETPRSRSICRRCALQTIHALCRKCTLTCRQNQVRPERQVFFIRLHRLAVLLTNANAIMQNARNNCAAREKRLACRS